LLDALSLTLEPFFLLLALGRVGLCRELLAVHDLDLGELGGRLATRLGHGLAGFVRQGVFFRALDSSAFHAFERNLIGRFHRPVPPWGTHVHGPRTLSAFAAAFTRARR